MTAPSSLGERAGFRGVKTKTLPEAIAQATRQAVIDYIRSDPDYTLGYLLAEMEEHDVDINEVTIGDLTGAPAKPRKRKAQAVEAKAVDTRSAEGRGAYDFSVSLCVLSDGLDGISAQEIRKACGGTPEQCRRALNRLIDEGIVTYRGQARATRYYPA